MMPNLETYLGTDKTNYIKTFVAIIITIIGLFCIFYFWNPKHSISNDTQDITNIQKMEKEINKLTSEIKTLDLQNSQLSSKISRNTQIQQDKISRIIKSTKKESTDETIKNFVNSW